LAFDRGAPLVIFVLANNQWPTTAVLL